MSDTREINTLLCFDFGTKRIGVAVGQSITKTASPLKTVKNKNNKPDWKDIEQLIKEWQPDALIVGIPQVSWETDTRAQVVALAQDEGFVTWRYTCYFQKTHGEWNLDECLSSRRQ